VFCLRAGEIKPLGLRDVGVEKDFYAVSDLTPGDVEFLRQAVIANSPLRARQLHNRLLRDFALVASANRLLKLQPEMADEAKEQIRVVVSNLDENYHESIELDLQNAISCMLKGSVDFFNDVSVAGMFLRALGLFSLGTKRTRERMKERVRFPLPGLDIDRIYGPMIHMLAVNIGRSLLLDRARYRIVLLHNETGVSFITGDQPVLNVHEERDENGTPREIEWHMPLSPKLAMLFLSAERAPDGVSVSITAEEAKNYCLRIAESHHDQLYGSDEEALLPYVSFSKADCNEG
jgi:hypothetical protein